MPQSSSKLRTTLTSLLCCLLSGTTLAQQSATGGIQVADLDRSAQPCDDFYQYANGTWRAKNPIPASMDRWSRRWQAGETNKEQLRTILDEDARAPQQTKGSPAQIAGDFYAACSDTKTIDAAGLKPLQPILDRIAAIHDNTSLQAEIRELQAIGINAPFQFSGTPDQHAPNNVIAEVGAAGLGLPDRDYYLKPDARFVQARAGYVAYLEKLFTLGGAAADQSKRCSDSVTF